jgi:hypothetical protein
MDRGPVRGWGMREVPPRRIRPGIALHALGSYNVDWITLARRPDLYEALALQRLGIPPDVLYIALTLDAPLGWSGYQYTLDGTRLHGPTPPGATVFLDFEPVDPDQITLPVRILAWCRRVLYQPTGEWVELRWHPTVGETRLVHQQAATRTQAETQAARKALDRGWQLLSPIGRTPADPQAVHGQLAAAVADLTQQTRTPTQEHVAEWLDMSLRQVQRLFAQHLGAQYGAWEAFVKKITGEEKP